MADSEKPALLIIDMVKDYFRDDHPYPITAPARAIIGPINELASWFRKRQFPVIFSTDAFQPDDFIFKGKMNPHAIAGTDGARVIGDLVQEPADLWIPKPRFSAFFKTGLETLLNDRKVTLCAVAGIATHFCVLTTVMDALSHDFKAVLLEDCSVAFPEQTHRSCVDIYRNNPLFPLLRVLNSAAFTADF